MDEAARAVLNTLADAIDVALDTDDEHTREIADLTARLHTAQAQVNESATAMAAMTKEAKAAAKALRELRAAHAELIADMQKEIDAVKAMPAREDGAVAYRVGSAGSSDVLVVWRGADTWAVTDGARAVWSAKDGWSTEDKLRRRGMTATARFARDAAFTHAQSLTAREEPE